MKRILLVLLVLSTLLLLLRCTGEPDAAKETDTSTATEETKAPTIQNLETYHTKGSQTVMAAFKNLSGKLKEKMQSEGPARAVAYCNVEAERLTSEKAGEVLSIGRVSDRNRNPENTPDEKEGEILKHYRAVFEKGDIPKDTVVLDGEVAHFYRPIMLQPLCLNCHGVPNEQILPETRAVIDSLYPADKARNYRIGDLRGMWHVAMAANHE